MFTVSSEMIFVALIVVGSVLLIGTIASVITATLVMHTAGVVKDYYKGISRSYDRTEDRFVENEKALRRLRHLVGQLYMMMDDASKVELPPEEVSRRIKDRIKATGIVLGRVE